MTLSLPALFNTVKRGPLALPNFNPKTWNAGRLADIGRNDGQPMSKTRGRKPEIIRPDDVTHCGQRCPYLRV